MEIITGVGRRRSWSSEEKVRLVGEADERGVAEVARRYEVCRSLLYRWRRQMRRGKLAVTAAAGFVPVRIAPELRSVDKAKDEPSAVPAELAAARASLVAKALEIETLKLQIARLRRQAFGRSSEKLGR